MNWRAVFSKRHRRRTNKQSRERATQRSNEAQKNPDVRWLTPGKLGGPGGTSAVCRIVRAVAYSSLCQIDQFQNRPRKNSKLQRPKSATRQGKVELAFGVLGTLTDDSGLVHFLRRARGSPARVFGQITRPRRPRSGPRRRALRSARSARSFQRCAMEISIARTSGDMVNLAAWRHSAAYCLYSAGVVIGAP